MWIGKSFLIWFSLAEGCCGMSSVDAEGCSGMSVGCSEMCVDAVGFSGMSIDATRYCWLSADIVGCSRVYIQ